MSAFNDTEGRTWEIRVNTSSLRDVQLLLDLNLEQLVKSPEPKELVGLLQDHPRCLDTLGVLCRDQIERRGMGNEHFGVLMAEGETLTLSKGILALADALAEFHPEGPFRSMLRAIHQPSMGGIFSESAPSKELPCMAGNPETGKGKNRGMPWRF